MFPGRLKLLPRGRSKSCYVREALKGSCLVVVYPDSASHGVLDGYVVLDVRQRRPEDPEATVHGSSIENLDHDLDIVRGEEPECARVLRQACELRGPRSRSVSEYGGHFAAPAAEHESGRVDRQSRDAIHGSRVEGGRIVRIDRHVDCAAGPGLQRPADSPVVAAVNAGEAQLLT